MLIKGTQSDNEVYLANIHVCHPGEMSRQVSLADTRSLPISLTSNYGSYLNFWAEKMWDQNGDH